MELFASAPGAALALAPLPHRVKVWSDDELLADTTAAVRVDEPDHEPTLYVPVGDVRIDRLSATGESLTCPVKGTAAVLARGGEAVAWRLVEPRPVVRVLADRVAFDHRLLRVEVIDGGPGEPEPDVTVKRFPTWGDAADLIDILDVRPVGERAYEGIARSNWRRSVVEGSQMLAQAMVAACRESPGRRVVSAHAVFARAADPRLPLRFELDEVSAGRTFSAYTVRVSQRSRACAAATVLLDVTAPDVMRHEDHAPVAGGLHDAAAYDMGVTGRDVRMVDDAYTGDPNAPLGPPELDAWVRFRSVPNDPALHAALLAQFTGHLSIAASMRPHAGIGQEQAHRTLSTGINAISLSMHADVRADQWMRYHHRSTFAGDGMTHAECRVYTEHAKLVASFTVEAMVRGFAAGTGAVDERTAM